MKRHFVRTLFFLPKPGGWNLLGLTAQDGRSQWTAHGMHIISEPFTFPPSHYLSPFSHYLTLFILTAMWTSNCLHACQPVHRVSAGGRLFLRRAELTCLNLMPFSQPQPTLVTNSLLHGAKRILWEGAGGVLWGIRSSGKEGGRMNMEVQGHEDESCLVFRLQWSCFP